MLNTLNDTHTISWRDGQPYANAFEDVYFSTENGLAETVFVFLDKNNLPQRFKALHEQSGHPSFHIVETGFGTGLNFLSTWQLWQEQAPADCQLIFTSVEKYPLQIDELRLALSIWPSLSVYSEPLLAQYAELVPGLNVLPLMAGKVVLHLWIGDIAEMLSNLSMSVDAWFLDGFAPAKNPDMWSEFLFKRMATLAHTQTTFATFTSAGTVRRGLLQAGFNVEKLAGFGKKREMLRGVFERATDLDGIHP